VTITVRKRAAHSDDFVVLAPAQIVSRIRRAIYVSLGVVFLVVAILGVFLPVLPTTPFLLLTSYFFVRSSPALHVRLLGSRLLGPFLRDWHRYRAVRPHVKMVAITTVLLTMTASVLLGRLSTTIVWVLLILGTTGLTVVLRLPVVRGNDDAAE
jgi:uncharacterized membrane protein YbaN (DUF454 family)